MNQSFKMFLCLYFCYDFFLLSASIHPIISKELSFRLRIHPKINQTHCPRKNIFLSSFWTPPTLPPFSHFGKFFSLSLLCVFEIFFLHQAVDGIRTESKINQWIARRLFFFFAFEKHSTSKDLKLLFAVFHIGFSIMMWPIHNNNILNIGSKPLYLVFIMSRLAATLSKI